LSHVQLSCFPQVEVELFPEMRQNHSRLQLRSVKLEESLVTHFVDEAMGIFKVNTAGPIRYLNSYRRYHDLLSGKASLDVTNFLKEEHSINGFKKVAYTP